MGLEQTGVDPSQTWTRIGDWSEFGWRAQRPAEEKSAISAVVSSGGSVKLGQGAMRNSPTVSVRLDGGWWWRFEGAVVLVGPAMGFDDVEGSLN